MWKSHDSRRGQQIEPQEYGHDAEPDVLKDRSTDRPLNFFVRYISFVLDQLARLTFRLRVAEQLQPVDDDADDPDPVPKVCHAELALSRIHL